MQITGIALHFSGEKADIAALPGRSLATDLIRAEPIESALRSRIIGRADAVLGTSWRAVHLRRGEVEVLSPAGATLLVGPAVAWLPWSDGMRLRIAAGSVGVHVLAGQAAVTNAIGYKAESADLRIVAGRPILAPLSGEGRTADVVGQCFEGMLAEVRGQGTSAMTVIEALLRILLISLWRMQGARVESTAATSSSRQLATRFNTLLEAHFRERWTVQRFAQALGISADRLTDLCRRTRGLSPKEIIDARTAIEARLLLEGSTASIDQIAHELGFDSAAHFNRFFRRAAGIPPGRYRQAVRNAPPVAQPAGRALYEWP
jgi:AraC family transcriptional activator of pobA